MIVLRSLIYQIGMGLITLFFSTTGNLLWPLPAKVRVRYMFGWAHVMMRWLRLTCGLSYRIEGRVPDIGPAIIMAKHQSAWETIALQDVFPPHSWVLKRELLWLPVFGWGLATMAPIAINRSKTKKAMQQILEQGRDRIKKGLWMVVFPEGTRVAAGQKGQYKQGGARMAIDFACPIVPVAHNAGEFWPRNGFLKYPGEITLVIGEPIDPSGKTAEQLTREVETWIETQMARIEGVGPCHPKSAKKSA